MTTDADEGKGRDLYRAPALEKGLDVLEALSGIREPLTATAIVQRLGRSTGELFRIIQVLERRGYITQGRGGYVLSPRLFELGIARAPVRDLTETALPIMRDLAERVRQSCHLAIAIGGDMVVLARVESPEQLGFSVRVGYRRPLHRSTSGLCLYAFQPPPRRAEWAALFDPAPDAAERARLAELADAIVAQGYADQPSRYTEGVRDLAAPIRRGDAVEAALAMPFLKPRDRDDADAAIAELRGAAQAISAALLGSDQSA